MDRAAWNDVTSDLPNFMDNRNRECLLPAFMESLRERYVAGCGEKVFAAPEMSVWTGSQFRHVMDVYLSTLELSKFTYFRFAHEAGKGYFTILPLLLFAPPEIKNRVWNLIEEWGKKDNFIRYSLSEFELRRMNEYYGVSGQVDLAIDVFLEKISMWEPVKYQFDKMHPDSDPDFSKILYKYERNEYKFKLNEEFFAYCKKLSCQYEADKKDLEKEAKAQGDGAGLPF